MQQLINDIIKNYNQHLKPQLSFTLGLSGGVDSVVLLHIFAKLTQTLPIKLNALHLNHGISSNANYWESFCINECDKLSIPINIVRHTVTKSGGESLENNARIIRYNEFAKMTDSVILLAHHKNDQIETMLSQLLRGSDIHNLGGMRYISEKNNQTYWRPLLHTTRLEIEQIAKNYSIQHIEDESNHDVTYLRNFIRCNLLPQMINWDENVFSKLIGVIEQIQDTANLLDEVATLDFKTVSSSNGLILLVDKFTILSKIRQINLLCYFIHLHQCKLPSRAKIAEFVRQINESAWDKHPMLALSNKLAIIKEKNNIYVRDHVC